MVKIILACSQKPLAAFIETALAEFDVEFRSVADAASLTKMVGDLSPDVILFNSGFPNLGDNATLPAELQAGSQIPIISVCEPTEIVLVDDAEEKQLAAPDVLMLPFSGNDLQQKIEKITGLKLAKKSGSEPGVAKEVAVPVEELSNEELQPEESTEKDEAMEKVENETVKTFELTEIVEEGLPLDELPDSVVSGSPLVDHDELVAEADSEDNAVAEKEVSSIATDVADSDLDDFSDSLDDLETDFQEAPSPESVLAGAEAGESEVTTLPDVELSLAPVVENEVLAADDSTVTDLESEFELPITETEPEPVVGDLDDLLDDDDFAEVEILEEDPVLAGLKSAGLTPEVETPEVESTPAEAGSDEDLAEDDSNDYEDLLDGVAAVSDESDGDLSGGETTISEAEVPADDADPAAEFVEMPQPEEISLLESNLIAAPLVTAGVAASVAAAVATADESEIELPEDYLEDEEIMSESSGTDLEIETQSESHPSAPSAQMAATPQPAETRVFTEPQSLDFSQQIEGMTQEWSKQLLQTTYASMDKMIKAIGDLAPTIVNQVAREVIPPLAEKVIKAEIARLEEQLKLEEGEEESDS